MNFKIVGQEIPGAVRIALVYDGDDVNIKVNDEIVAWFEPSGKLIIQTSALEDEGFELDTFDD